IIGLLHLAYLYVAAFLIGVLTAFFDVAYQAYLPAIVDRGQLVDANSKLETSNTIAGTFGPSIAGPVIDRFKAPFAMRFDAALFLLFLKDLGFTATTLGLLFGLSSVGGILGAIFSGRIAKRIGVGPAIILGAVIFGLPPLPLPFVTSSIALPAIAILLGISFF